MSPYRLGHFLLGIEGLALLRGGADEAGRARRLDEIRSIADRIDEEPYSRSRAATPVDTVSGYGAWAATYDEPGNVTVQLEEEVVRGMLDALPAGAAVLDAACGTGRHAVHLAARGLHVIGVDSSPAMLERAREKLPGADLRVGELADLPLADESVDAVVCALALSHEPDLGPAVGELARVLRPGGAAIVSNPHPLATAFLDWRATVADARGERRVIPEFPHGLAASIEAFLAAGLQVRGCVERALSPGQAAAEAKAGLDEAFRVALTGFPVVVVWRLEKA